MRLHEYRDSFLKLSPVFGVLIFPFFSTSKNSMQIVNRERILLLEITFDADAENGTWNIEKERSPFSDSLKKKSCICNSYSHF